MFWKLVLSVFAYVRFGWMKQRGYHATPVSSAHVIALLRRVRHDEAQEFVLCQTRGRYAIVVIHHADFSRNTFGRFAINRRGKVRFSRLDDPERDRRRLYEEVFWEWAVTDNPNSERVLDEMFRTTEQRIRSGVIVWNQPDV